MTLHFTVSEKDALAFTERYLRDSKLHQALRTRFRWLFPCVFIAIACVRTGRDGFSLAPIFFGALAVMWWFFFPRMLGSGIRKRMKKQMAESSHAESFGAYELQLLDEHLVSTSPLGSGTYAWRGVDRVAMDSEYLYIFLSGPLGYPIRISEIGLETARSAHDFVAERVRLSRP